MSAQPKKNGRDKKVTIAYIRIAEMLRLPGNRDVKENHVKKLQRGWNEQAIGVFVLSAQSDGSYYILDGQHRHEVLLREGRGGDSFAAEVHYGLSPEEELDLCRTLNVDRRPWGAVDVFKADLELKRPQAMEIKEIVESNGFSLNLADGKKDGGRIAAIGALTYVYRNYQAGTLNDVLAVLHGAFSNSEGFTGEVIRGVAAFIATYRDHQNYSRAELIRVLSRSTASSLEARGRETKLLIGVRTEEGVTFQCLVAYNHKKRGRRLPDWGAA